MKSFWERRIARAEELSTVCVTAAELLSLYVRIAIFQKSVFEELAARRETDPATLTTYFPPLLDLVDRYGPPAAAGFARQNLGSEAERDRIFARVLLQPFAESLAVRGNISADTSSGKCPFCGAHPVAAVLRGEGDGGKRFLVCSLCSTEWEFRRILCPACGEGHKDKLPVYVTETFDYIRIESCDTCQTYLKSIDLTKNGLAVPIVDELASVSLNVWAEEHGYTKIEPNLLGL
jgi:FdhE protein